MRKKTELKKEKRFKFEKASVTFQKEVTREGKMYKLISFKSADVIDLPEEYRTDYPNFWGNRSMPLLLRIHPHSHEILRYYVGSYYAAHEVTRMIKTMKNAGKRLTEITRKMNNDAEKHTGIFTIKI